MAVPVGVSDRWQVTRDKWHKTYDPYAELKMIEDDELYNKWATYNAVFTTAPGTMGGLNRSHIKSAKKKQLFVLI